MWYMSPAEGGDISCSLCSPGPVPQIVGGLFHKGSSSNLHLNVDAPVVADTQKRPLIMFSHGAGSNGLYYAWFGEYLAARGYLVAMLYHYRANTYDQTVMYTRSNLWQRPRDITLDLTNLLQDQVWGPHIDPNRIGVAGHSQGGVFPFLVGGAKGQAHHH